MKSQLNKVEVDLRKIDSAQELCNVLLESNPEFMNFLKNDREEFIKNYPDIIKFLGKKRKSSSKYNKTTSYKTSKKKKLTRRQDVMVGGISTQVLARYIRIGIYFLYCIFIAYGLYQGRDMLMDGINQVLSGQCDSLSNRFLGGIGLGVRHPFCDMWYNFTNLIMRSFIGLETSAMMNVAVGGGAPVITIYIQHQILNYISDAVANRINGTIQSNRPLQNIIDNIRVPPGATSVHLLPPTIPENIQPRQTLRIGTRNTPPLSYGIEDISS